ncbi:aldehyde dehydrogenase family protein [Cytobacillus sp. FSL W7-1323]|uniref:aldehyde dehydrogenase family protein n=1 Tax=Cytobacillus sp. FSL W7-1323 TaxID=2921700 RepID=UPI0031590B5C
MANTTLEINPIVQAFLSGTKEMFLNGKWVPAIKGKVYESINPTTNEILAKIYEGDEEDLDVAVKAARRAFEGSWKNTAPRERARLLNKLADLLEENLEVITQLDALDYGGTLAVAGGFAENAVHHVRYYAGWATKLYGNTLELTSGGNIHAFTKREPLGVCGQITSWNFPALVACWKIAAPIAAGNTVVIKPSQQTSLSTLYIGKLIEDAGFPPGVVNIVTGAGGKLGEAITSHPDIDKIGFTGSTSVGRRIMEKASKSLKKITLELGGKSPNIIFADADLNKAIPGAIKAILMNTGQVCAAGSRLYIERSVYDTVKEKLVEIAESFVLGDPLDPNAQMGPLISKNQITTVEKYVELAKKDGATILTGGKRPDSPDLQQGNFYLPTIIEGLDEKCQSVYEEIFGPVLCIMPFDSIEEVVERANATEYGLASGVWTTNIETTHKMVDSLNAGSVWVNEYYLTDDNIPLTGFKQSGIGSELGLAGIEAYTKVKSVAINHG